MLTDDYILTQIDALIRFMQTILFNQDKEFDGAIDNIQFYNEQELLRSALQRRLEQLKINDAENLLFEEIEKNPDHETIKVGLWFYHKLLSLDEKLLEEHDFSKDEILDGLQEIESHMLAE